MGYDVHITRRAEWSDKGDDIRLDEWIAFVRAAPDMTLTGTAEATVGKGEILRVESPGLATWDGHSQKPSGHDLIWFDHRRGKVVVKNPDTEILMKMWSIAQHFGARVQGDEGEIYDERGNPLA